MIRYVRGFVHWLAGEGSCPACEGPLTSHEAGHYECECGAVVDYERGGWAYASESRLRRLPGLSGIPFDKEAA